MGWHAFVFVDLLRAGNARPYYNNKEAHSPFFRPLMDSSAFLTRLKRLVAWRG